MKKLFLACFIGLICVTSAFAAWPAHDITVIVLYPAGGGTNLTARMLVNEINRHSALTSSSSINLARVAQSAL